MAHCIHTVRGIYNHRRVQTFLAGRAQVKYTNLTLDKEKRKKIRPSNLKKKSLLPYNTKFSLAL